MTKSKQFFSYELEDVEIINKEGYILVKHKHANCPKDAMLTALITRRDRRDACHECRNLRMMAYKEKDEYASPNTIRVSLITHPEGLNAKEADKILDIIFRNFLKPLKNSRPKNSHPVGVTKKSKRGFHLSHTAIWENLQKELANINQTKTNLMAAKASLELQAKQIFVKIKLASELLKSIYSEKLALEDQLNEAEIDLHIILGEKSNGLALRAYLKDALEQLRLNVEATVRGPVSQQDLMSFYGSNVFAYLENAKMQFMLDQQGREQAIREKIEFLKKAIAMKVQSYANNHNQATTKMSVWKSQIEDIQREIAAIDERIDCCSQEIEQIKEKISVIGTPVESGRPSSLFQPADQNASRSTTERGENIQNNNVNGMS